MTRNRILLCCSLWAFLHGLVLPAAFGHGAMGAYADIGGSNVFRLKAPEVRPAEPPPEASASIRLTGITTLFAHKLALLKVRLPGNASEPAQELALSLEEGQREKNLEVLSIDEKAGRVELLCFGTRRVVSFEAEAPPQPGPAKAAVRPLPLRVSARFPNP